MSFDLDKLFDLSSEQNRLAPVGLGHGAVVLQSVCVGEYQATVEDGTYSRSYS